MKTKVLISILLAILCQTLPAQKQQENATFENPMIFADVPDLDIIRLGDTYYMVSTTMHFAPGCGIMKSKDLVNWEIVNYAYDELDEGDNFRLLNGKNEYSQGSWAANLRYDPYEKMFYMIMTCTQQAKPTSMSRTILRTVSGIALRQTSAMTQACCSMTQALR